MTEEAKQFTGTARSYMGVLNNPETPIEIYFKKFMDTGKVRYITGQLEIGEETKTPHYQFYINLVTPQRITALKKICPRAHWEKVRSDTHSIAYCNKEETRAGPSCTLGEKPMHRNSATDWQQVWESAKVGDMESIPHEIRIKHYRTLMAI